MQLVVSINPAPYYVWTLFIKPAQDENEIKLAPKLSNLNISKVSKDAR